MNHRIQVRYIILIKNFKLKKFNYLVLINYDIFKYINVFIPCEKWFQICIKLSLYKAINNCEPKVSKELILPVTSLFNFPIYHEYKNKINKIKIFI